MNVPTSAWNQRPAGRRPARELVGMKTVQQGLGLEGISLTQSSVYNSLGLHSHVRRIPQTTSNLESWLWSGIVMRAVVAIVETMNYEAAA